MVQIIQEQERQKGPSFMDRLGKAAGIAAHEIPRFLMQQEQKKAQEMKMQQENEVLKNLTGIDFSGIQDPRIRQRAYELATEGKQKEKGYEESRRSEAQKSEHTQELQNQRARQQRQLQKQKYDFESQRVKPDNAAIKREQEEKEKKETHERAQNSFNSMSEILRKGTIGRGSGVKSYFGGESARDTGRFLSASAGLEAMLVDMVNRGALSNSRFKYITETVLPKPTDSDAEIEGKLTELANLLGLDSSALSGKKISKSNEKQSLQDIFQ